MIKPKKSNCDKTQQLKGEQDTAELGANTDANLWQLFTYAGPMSTHVEPNQMILDILIDQLQ